MEKSTTYQFRVMPSNNPKSYMTLDSDPQRRCEKNIVYTISEDLFSGANVKFRIRRKAREFATGKTFVVIYNNNNRQECLYFFNLYLKKPSYLPSQIRPILYLTRCIGSNTSKKHFSKIYNYIISHYEELYALELGDVIEVAI